MAVAVVITTVTLQTDGLHVSGTVGGGATKTVIVSPDSLRGMTVANMQLYLAVLLAEVNAVTITIASLQGTVNL